MPVEREIRLFPGHWKIDEGTHVSEETSLKVEKRNRKLTSPTPVPEVDQISRSRYPKGGLVVLQTKIETVDMSSACLVLHL